MIETLLTTLAAALLGCVVTMRRRDLDLSPRRTAAMSGALGGGAALALAVVGADWQAYALFAGLAPLAVFDARRKLLPDDLTLPLIALGVGLGFAAGDGAARVIGAALGWGALRALGALWPEPDAMGRGDAKLFAAIGAFLGWAALPEVALIGALAAIAFALPRHRGAVARVEIAFGPALILGALSSVLFGPFFGPVSG